MVVLCIKKRNPLKKVYVIFFSRWEGKNPNILPKVVYKSRAGVHSLEIELKLLPNASKNPIQKNIDNRIITHLTEIIKKKEMTAPYLLHILYCISKTIPWPPSNSSPFTLNVVTFKKIAFQLK